MYDKTPVYPHQRHLPWAHEPLKFIYVSQHLLTTILLALLWLIYYSILPRSFRPRPSWSIIQVVVVKFTKRLYKVTEVAGVIWRARDPTHEPDEKSLKETRFSWVPPLPDEFCTGIVNDDRVRSQRVGTFIWPRLPPPNVRVRPVVKSGDGRLPESIHLSTRSMVLPIGKISDHGTITTSAPAKDVRVGKPHHYSVNEANNLVIEAGAAASPPRAIGLYLHGGGYCHLSAHENAITSRIPRRLMKDNLFQEIHAVEYRLIQHAPVPGALQDAAAVYAHLVTHYLGARRGPDGKYHYPNWHIPYHAHLHDPSTRQDAVFNIFKFGPSIGQALDCEARPTSFVIPPGTVAPLAESRNQQHANKKTVQSHDDRRDSVKPLITGNDATPRSHVNTSYFTDHIAAAHRPRIILIGDSAGGNLVLALARWIRDEGILPAPDGMLLLSPCCDLSYTLPQVPASRRPRPHADADYLLDTPEPLDSLARAFLGHHPIEMIYSPYISPASEWVLSAFHGEEGMGDSDLQPPSTYKYSHGCSGKGIENIYDPTVNGVSMDLEPNGRSAARNPYIRVPQGVGLFTDFPRALVVAGDAERLEREMAMLERALAREGVRVRTVWAKDAVHDILVWATWDERVREGVWTEIGRWIREVAME